MADLNVSLILRLVDKATAPARAAMRMIDRMGGEGVMRQAARVQRGSVMMASGLGTVAGTATRAVGVLGDYRTILAGIGIGAIAGGFIRTAAEFERYNVQLTNLEGSAEGAKRAMDWIETFATKTPLQVDQTVEAYAKLRAFGLDPTNGTLEALVDTMAATGGSNEMLASTILALGQAQTMSRLRGEEALQLQERGIPVYELLAKKLGKTTAEIIEMQNAGELGREEIALLIEAMGEANKGAAEDMSYTWDGIISNLWDYWSKFQRMVMKSGVFDHLKGRLQSLLTVLNRMAADGTLLRWAEAVSSGVIAMLQGLWDFGAGVVSVWQEVEPWITWAAEAVGGFSNALGILVAIKFGSTILGLIGGFMTVGGGAWVALTGVASLAGRVLGLTEDIGTIGPAMGRAAAATETATSRMNRAIRGVNVKAVTAGIGGALALASIPEFDFKSQYEAWQKSNRDGMESFFRKVPGLSQLMKAQEGLNTWWSIKSTPTTPAPDRPSIMDPRTDYPYSPYYNDHGDIRPGANPPSAPTPQAEPATAISDSFKGVYNSAERFFSYVTGWSFSDVTTKLTGAFNVDLFSIGTKIIDDLWSGMKSIMSSVVAWAKAQLAGIAPTIAVSASVTSSGGGFTGNPMGDYDPYAADGARSTGGPVRAGGIYRWQENGEEFFRPSTDGTVINARGSRALRAGAGRTTNISLGGIVINAAPGQSPQAIAREVMALAERKFGSGGSLALHDGGDFDV